MTTLAALTGYAPDSAYATWCAEEREAADRMEFDFNLQRGAILALADEKRGHTVRGMTDDGLRRLAKTYRRELEDIEAGDRHATKRQCRALEIRLRDVEGEQEFRAALAGSWLASDEGTHDYTAFGSRGGLDAVLHHGAMPPSYDLAVLLDWERWKRGTAHVLDWKQAA